MSQPAVSVITATYNRSDVLALAIRSVIEQTMADWEMLIVGDACTDDTADTVAAFGDDRIHFVNREENHGEQSVPNNDGVAMGRGGHIAFLNHDDLWYPDHLEVGLDTLARTGADLAYALRATLLADRRVIVAGNGAIRERLLCAPLPASTWIQRRELSARIGPWRSAFDLRVSPSQDWLMRALDAGALVVGTDALTVVSVPAGIRDFSYVRTEPEDIDAALALLGGRPALAAGAGGGVAVIRGGFYGWARRALWRPLETMLRACGYHPYKMRSILNKGFRRGAFIRRARERRGLPADPQRSRHE